MKKMAALSLATLLGLASIAGCSRAYHSYADCYVPCGYCAPPPLPYMQYCTGCPDAACAETKPVTDKPVPIEDSPELSP